MCRNIRVLHNFKPPTTEAEVRAAALQFVRKVSGTTKPSKINQAACDHAVEIISAATMRLLGELVATTPPRTREEEAAKGRLRWQRRMAARS